MTPQQKADELFNAYYQITCNMLDAKECCLVHIKDMLKECRSDMKGWWKEVMVIIEQK